MKFSSIGRASLASLLSLSACLGVTACSRNYTVAFLYSLGTKNAAGVVNVFHVDYQSGALLQLPDSPVDAGGQNPVALVTTSDQKDMFVALQNDHKIQPFHIGTDGKLYAHDEKSLIGSFPVAIALSADNKFLYVLTRLRGSATSGAGSVEVYPVDANSRALGTGTAFNVGLNPVGLVASADNKFVYVIHRDPATTQNLIAFSRDTGTGALTALPNSHITATNAIGYQSGIEPAGIVEDPKARYIYVTDRAANQLIGYTLNSIGEPVPMNNGPYSTGSYPLGVTIDPRGKYVYVANFNANSISAYAIDAGTGNLSLSVGSATTQTGTGPTCVTIENALGIYLYTTNQLDSNITGKQLNASTGALKDIQGTPFPTSTLPSCAVAVANGEHATQIVQ
ncbi:MAG: beta-propeller fold lactonase family protein [Acidobacteria bacterium]|nr:beta-propeller fold lactonase family protein [Acidobacteriota bacterium]